MTDTSLAFSGQIASATSTLSINSIYLAFTEGKVDLRPPFQRNLIWNIEQQSLLVDSVLRGLPVPEVYVQVSISDDGDEQTIVVDGQQRIAALLTYLGGEYSLKDSNEELSAEWRGLHFAELSNDLKLRFRSFELVVRKLPAMSDDALRKIFSRLNKTVEALEPQELRHAAYTSPFIQYIEVLSARPAFAQVGVFSPLDYRRRRNDEFLAEVAFAVGAKAFPNKKEDLDALFFTFDRQGMPVGYLEDLERRMGRVVRFLEFAAPELRKSRFRNKSDFYSLCVFLAGRAEKLPNVDKTKLVAKLVQFSASVNALKKAETVGDSTDSMTKTPTGKRSLAYLRAVERAASDRLNRVRRNEALSTLLAPLFSEAETAPLERVDASWESALEVEEYDDPDEAEMENAVSVLYEHPTTDEA